MATIGTSAYFDESGVDRSNTIAVVAGFVASTEMWIAFEKAWSKQMALKPEKLNWKKYVQQNPIEFAKIARKFSLKAIDFPCSQVIFEDIRRENSVAGLRYLDNIYAYCSRECCDLLDAWANGRKLGKSAYPVKVVFDKGSEHQLSLDRGYEAYFKSKKNTYLEGAAIFERDEVSLPLQAAHLFAWLLSKHYNKRTPEEKALRIIGRDGHATLPIAA